MFLAALALTAVQHGYHPSGPRIEVMLSNHKSFVITTDPKMSPKTVQAIVKLVREGFYDDQKVHRVEPWIVQWGDPQTKHLPIGDSRIGPGGSGHPIPFEGPKRIFDRGVAGIASKRDGVGGEGQIFIVKRRSAMLDGGYAMLGKVTEGMEVVDHIKLGEKIESVTIVGAHRDKRD
ncbi:MAG TPA: peptidylprolyl isomerase [Fimbriimonas sp.]|nr:peptidylprolyl isomerase [Fimbriimonas sp.]